MALRGLVDWSVLFLLLLVWCGKWLSLLVVTLVVGSLVVGSQCRGVGYEVVLELKPAAGCSEVDLVVGCCVEWALAF